VKSIFLVDSFYYSVIESLKIDDTLAPGVTYEQALAGALEFGFGTGTAYVRELRALGWDSNIVIANARGLQSAWARENGARNPIGAAWKFGPHLARLPVVADLLHIAPHLHRVLLDQIVQLKPDVVLVQDLNLVPPGLARAIKKHTRLLVGEIASPLPPRRFLQQYDLIVSALPSIVTTAREWGIAAESIPLAFDERWTTISRASTREIDAIFVGSFSRLQPTTAPLLRAVADRIPTLRIYGSAPADVLAEHGLAGNHHGPAWGGGMFELLGNSKMVINRHGSIAGPYAVNMRMFETTGSGAALVTEAKSNLGDFFDVGTEVVAYESIEDAADQAAALLADPDRLDSIAAAGQARTLGEHTYAHRAERLAEIANGFPARPE
jgi:spore maturation protein CgeB